MGKMRRTRTESLNTRPRFPTHLVVFDVVKGRRGARISQRAMRIRIPTKNPSLMINPVFFPKGIILFTSFLSDNHP